jgi:hypothetical protein
MSQPAFSNGVIGSREVAELLTLSTENRHHKHLSVDLQIAEVIGICTGFERVSFDLCVKQLLATERERAASIDVLENVSGDKESVDKYQCILQVPIQIDSLSGRYCPKQGAGGYAWLFESSR